jgi:nucleotide-binding universal stress UspA family protein
VFRSILVALDDSAASVAALDQAIDLARAEGARLTLISVAAPPRWRPAGPFVPPYPTDAQLEVEAREILDRAEERVPDDVAVATVFRSGLAAKEILKRAECACHDLIVMGSRGLGPAASLVLGSVSRAVVAQSKIPVLIARAPAVILADTGTDGAAEREVSVR